MRIAEALLLDDKYAGRIDAEHITAAIRDVTAKQLAEAKEVAFSGRLPGWRALAAVLFRAHTAPQKRARRAAPAKHASAEPEASEGLAPASVEAPAPPAPAHAPGLEASPTAAPTHGVSATVASRLANSTQIRGASSVPTTVLISGIAAWRRGGPWPVAWGPAPDHPECGVPGSLLGGVLTLAGTPRWEAVVERAVVLWRRDRTWPATGWGLPPDHPDCAVPERFRQHATAG